MHLHALSADRRILSRSDPEVAPIPYLTMACVAETPRISDRYSRSAALVHAIYRSYSMHLPNIQLHLHARGKAERLLSRFEPVPMQVL